MLAVLVIAAAGCALLGLLLLGAGRRSRYDDVERFHRASAMTSEWARGGLTHTVVAPREPDEQEERAQPPRRKQRADR